MGLFTEFKRQYGSDVGGAVALARGLMEGDAAKFKAGYSAENAYIAAIDAAEHDGVGFSGEQLAEIRERVGA